MEKIINPTSRIIDIVFKEIKSYETETISLGNKVFSQYNTLNTIVTHQNKGFLFPYSGEGEDPRDYFDIGSPIIATRVVNTDLDTKDFEPYTDNSNHLGQELLAKPLFKHFLGQTNEGQKLNELIEDGHDTGNIVVRKVNNPNNTAEIYMPVLLTNLYVIDTTARTLEDTVVIEKEIMNQTTLRKMKEWSNLDKVVALGNMNKDDDLPSYEIYYRYGEISKANFNYIQNELTGKEYEPKEGDDNEYIQALIVVAKAKKGKKYNGENNVSQGVVVFCEELIPEVIKVSNKLQITKYKPYEEYHSGAYKGRWLREGAREVLIPYQNNANDIKNRFREVLEQASIFVYWSQDEKIAAKNVLSSIKKGQIINTKHLAVLNNVFPNLALFANEWNGNIRDAEKALKAFEVASGESLPSSTSATAVAVQNQQVGKYYNFIQEGFGFFFSCIYKRWVIPTLLEKTSDQEKLEIIGDPEFLNEYAKALAKGKVLQSLFEIAVNGNFITQEEFDKVVEFEAQLILKQKKKFLEMEKDYFKDVELYIRLNPTGELFNKQARVSNGLQLIQYITDAEARAKMISEIANELGFKISPQAVTPPVQPQNTSPTSATPNISPDLPTKEQPVKANML